jgi:AraC family transcriptional regulator
MAKHTENKYSKIISQVGQYIFDHSHEVILLDELSAYTGFSKYHFNRLFFVATGYQLGEYIQRCKLDKALHALKHDNHNILDVALSVGYDSASSFTRAFHKVFSVTPSEVKQGKLPFNERGGSMLLKKSSSENLLQPTWHDFAEREIIGLSERGFSKQSFSKIAGSLYGRLTILAAPLSYDELQPVGVSIDNPWVGEQENSQFFAGFTRGLEYCKASLEVFTWRAGCWVCFIHKGPHDVMWQTISQVYAQWVIPNNITLKDQQIVQVYRNNPQTTATQELETELYFSVDKTPV